MNNYEWQKQYARQRIDARLREAEAHRLAKSAHDRRPRRRFFLGALLASIGRRLRSGGEQLPAVGGSRKMTDQSI